MTKIRLVALLLAWICCFQLEAGVYKESRIVGDVSHFDLAEVRGEPGLSWIIAEVDPAPTSGHIQAPGTHIQNGELHVPPGSSWAAYMEGTVYTGATLAGPPVGPEIPYRWQAPFQPRSRGDRALSSSFRDERATTICAVSRDGEGSERFPRVVVVPPRWIESIEEAREVLRKETEIFAPPMTESDLKALERLVAGPNPWIAIAAFKMLLENRREALAPVREEPWLQGAFTMLRLEQGSEGLPQALEEVLTAQRSPREVTAIALGAFAALTNREGDDEARAAELLHLIRQRFAAFSLESELLDGILENTPDDSD